MNEQELKHYGVKGMKWGVYRASKQLAKATDTQSRDKATAKLRSHREKGTAEIAKLKKKKTKLDAKSEKHAIKTDTKVAKLQQKAAKNRKKMVGRFTSVDKAKELEIKAVRLEAKATRLAAKSAKAKAKVLKNEKMQRMFEKEISNIDQALIAKGKRALAG